MEKGLCKEMGSSFKDGFVDVHSRGFSHPNVRFYCLVAGAKHSTVDPILIGVKETDV